MVFKGIVENNGYGCWLAPIPNSIVETDKQTASDATLFDGYIRDVISSDNWCSRSVFLNKS